MSAPISVYQCGPIADVDDGGATWRDSLKDEYDDVEWLDPLDDYDVPRDELTIVRGEGRMLPEGTVAEGEIIESDISMIEKSDAVLVNWKPVEGGNVVTVGTPMEMRMAWGMGKAVVVNSTNPVSNPNEHSPWLTYHANGFVGSLQEAVEWVQALHTALEGIDSGMEAEA